MAFISLPKLFLSIVALLAARRVYWEVTTGSRRRAFAKRHGCLPPKRWKFWDPILGLDNMVENFTAMSQHRVLEWWESGFLKNNAHFLVLPVLGGKFHFTDEPENVKAMLATHFHSWSLGKERIKMMSDFMGNGIFTNEGAPWKHSRGMLRPCFERSQVADLSILEKHTDAFLKLIPKDGTTIDLQPLFHKLMLDITTEFLFGRSTNLLDPAQNHKDVDEFIEAFEYCMNPLEDPSNKKWGVVMLMLFTIFLPDWKAKRMAKTIDKYAEKMVDEHITEREQQESKETERSRYVFLDELFSETQDKKVIRSELLNIFFAGSDTTTAFLSSLLFEVSRHPDIMARLRSEIKEHAGDQPPTYQQLKDMKYLKAVLNETQRLHPVVPFNSREATEDTTLPRGGGPDGTSPVYIPKGTIVAYIPYAMHRRRDIYGEDTEKFDPTRWIDGEHPSSPLRPDWGYLPFSGGPRVCIGQQFAITEVSYILVRLLQAFKEMESRDDEPWREKLSLVCSSLGGAKVGLKN